LEKGGRKKVRGKPNFFNGGYTLSKKGLRTRGNSGRGNEGDCGNVEPDSPKEGEEPGKGGVAIIHGDGM